MYLTFKFLHLMGVAILIGNVTASAVWKVFANRTADPAVIAFAQRLITYTDWSLTLSGILLIIVGGYGMAYVGQFDLTVGWLVWGQLLFVVSGAMWLAILLPLQVEQARMARSFAMKDSVDDAYWPLCRRWIIWGVLATIPLVAATYVMVLKP